MCVGEGFVVFGGKLASGERNKYMYSDTVLKSKMASNSTSQSRFLSTVSARDRN